MTERALRVLVVDDEAPARLLLREYLADLPAIEIVGECGNGFEALRAASEQRPDLVLLDVQMPKLDGFEVVDLWSREPEGAPAIIFVTAFDAHAVRAFEVEAVDFLMKPVRPERLREAIDRVRARRSAGAEPGGPAALALRRASREPERYLERIAIKEGPAVTVVPVETIDFVEAKDDYVVFHVAGGRRHQKQQTLQELAEQLDPGRFVRIHRSILLPLDRLARLETYAKDSRVAFLRDGRRLPVSRAGYERLRELL